MAATKAQKSVRLVEIAAMRKPASIDREAGIVRGVKILGSESANGRTYTESARRNAASLYEGARVNINHRKPGSGDRPYQERFGVIRNVESKTDGLYGDLHYNPKHALAEQFAWDAENAPHNVGLSHDAEGRTRTERGKVLVEEITRVHSVDLVSDPATNRGLFESENYMDPAMETPTETGGAGSIKDMILSGVAKILDGDGEPNAKAGAIKTLVAKLLKVEADVDAAMNGGTSGEGGESTPAAESKVIKPAGEATLQEQMQVLLNEKHVRKLLAEAKCEISEALVESLALIPTEAGRKAAVAALPKAAAPTTPGRPGLQPRSSAPAGEPIQESISVPEKKEDFVKLFR